MGNVALVSSKGSMPVEGQVRVLQADGKVLYFVDPVLAIQVLQEHPGHLVVRCGPSSMSNEMIWGESYTTLTYDKIKQMSSSRHNFAMLRADEKLNTRSTYFLLPIKAKKQLGAWSYFLRALKTPKVAPGEFHQRSDSWGLEKKRSLLRRSRSVPRPREPFQPVHEAQQLQQQQFQQEQHQQKQQQKLTSSVSFPGRSVDLYPRDPFTEGVERGPLSTIQNKRPRRVLRPSQIGWKPILESISEGVGEFSDDEDYSGHFHRTQSKYLRLLHSYNSHPDGLRTTANLRPLAV